MKPRAHMMEGPEIWKRFKSAMKTVLELLRSKIKQLILEDRHNFAHNPNRRGPKRKNKASTARGRTH